MYVPNRIRILRDVLYECSDGNHTKGTKDVENDVIQRTSGITHSTWNRKLDTGDTKDMPITAADSYVLFAHGEGDYFTYHGAEGAVQCKVNFHTGAYMCPAK
jgi:hypothetical protein